jgi:carboxylate-amine ligase
VDTIVVIAGLFRALVEREAAAERGGIPATVISSTMGRAAAWRAARSGLEGQLVDIDGPASRPAADVVTALVESLRPQLEAAGDWQLVRELTWRVLTAGSSAARQRRALRRRGRLTDVVDQLIAETAGRWPDTASAAGTDPSLLFGYRPAPDEPPDSYDEAVADDGQPRERYASILNTLAGLGGAALRASAAGIEQDQRADGITFRVSGQDRSQLLPFDLVPRVIEADEWTHLSAGLSQRARALDAFLHDVYGEQAIIGDGIVDLAALDRASGFRSTGRRGKPRVRAHVCGTDLISDRPGHWLVLEDNLRIPSGAAYAVVNRRLLTKHLPQVPRPAGIADVETVAAMLLDTLRAAAPGRAGDDVSMALISSGWEDSAWFEHTFLAKEMGIPVVRPAGLSVRDGKLLRHNASHGGEALPIDVAYVRMDEDMLLSSNGHDGAELGPGLLQAVDADALSVVNALGNGIGDDKAIYAQVPAMIEYYLGEKPVLDQVRTWICAHRDQRDYVLDHLADLVVKPVDGLGGQGVIIGPEADDDALRNVRTDLETRPERYIAQDVISLSTHPTFDGEGLFPHHVDLRAFVHLRPGPQDSVTAHVVPTGLTRVGPLGSRIVNSSAGGASKDTWILTEPKAS